MHKLKPRYPNTKRKRLILMYSFWDLILSQYALIRGYYMSLSKNGKILLSLPGCKLVQKANILVHMAKILLRIKPDGKSVLQMEADENSYDAMLSASKSIMIYMMAAFLSLSLRAKNRLHYCCFLKDFFKKIRYKL